MPARSAFKALSALTVNFLITLTIKISVNCFHTHPRGKSYQPKSNNIKHVDFNSLIVSIEFDSQIPEFD